MATFFGGPFDGLTPGYATSQPPEQQWAVGQIMLKKFSERDGHRLVLPVDEMMHRLMSNRGFNARTEEPPPVDPSIKYAVYVYRTESGIAGYYYERDATLEEVSQTPEDSRPVFLEMLDPTSRN